MADIVARDDTLRKPKSNKFVSIFRYIDHTTENKLLLCLLLFKNRNTVTWKFN